MKPDMTVISSQLLSESYIRVQHASGLWVYVMQKPTVSMSATLCVMAGGCDTRFYLPGQRRMTTVPDGTAHFLEHKIFASEDGGDVMPLFTAIGATCDAYTTPDITCYLCNTLDHKKESLGILLDFVTHPYFTKENVASEHDIIAQELAMYEDAPSQIGYYNLMRAMYKTHPAKKNVGGTRRSIQRITPDVLYTFHRAFYVPENMILCVAGDITVDEVLSVCDEHLPKENNQPTARRADIREARDIVRNEVKAYSDVPMPLLYLGYKSKMPSEDPIVRMTEETALDLANDILFGPSSHFYSENYKKGLIGSRFGVDVTYTQTTSHTVIDAETPDPDALIAAYIATLENEKTSPSITEEVFIRAKRVMYASAAYAFDSNDDMVNECISYAADGTEFFTAADIAERMTLSEMYEILYAYYDTMQFAKSLVLPKSYRHRKEK